MAEERRSFERGGPKQLGIAIALPVALGLVAALVCLNAQAVFEAFEKPPLTVPGWVFPVAWTIIYVLMGLASYVVWKHRSYTKHDRNAQWAALLVYVAQLVFHFVWPILFFRAGLQMISFVWLLGLWAMILSLVVLCYRIELLAAGLLVPSLLWVAYCGYLNLAIAILN